jgi:hypothetical protein
VFCQNLKINHLTYKNCNSVNTSSSIVSRLANKLRFCSHLLITLTAAVVTHDCVGQSEDKKGTRSKSVDSNGKGPVLSNSTYQLFQWQNYKQSLEINRQMSSHQSVFESIISRFKIAYAPNEHITFDEQLAMFINNVHSIFFLFWCILMSFYMFIKSKPKKCGIQVWDAAGVNSCYAYSTQAYSG